MLLLRVATVALLAYLAACGPRQTDPGPVVAEDGTILAGAFGEVHPTAAAAVAELTAFPPAELFSTEPSEERTLARRRVLTLGEGAAPALAEQLRAAGCDSPGSAEALELLMELSRGGVLTSAQSIAFVDLALTAHAGAERQITPPVAAFDALISGLAADQLVSPEGLAAVEAELAARSDEAARRSLRRRCSAMAAGAGPELLRSGAISIADVLLVAGRQLRELPPGAEAGVAMVQLIREAAANDHIGAGRLEAIALDERVHLRARGLACDGAAERLARLDALADAPAGQPTPIARCLVWHAAGRMEWGPRIGAAYEAHPDRRIRRAADKLLRPNDNDEGATAQERLLARRCDAVLRGPLAATAVAEASRHGGRLCLVEATISGTLVLETPGVELLSVPPGASRIDGHVVLKRPAALIGFQASGSLLVGPGADGSLLLSVSAQGTSVMAAEAALVLGVVAPSWIAAWPAFDGAWSVPPAARGLGVVVEGRDLATVGQLGGARGWVDRLFVRPQPRPEGVPPSPEMIAAWLGAGLPLDAPDRFPATPKRGWIALVGEGDVTGTREGFAVPLAVAPWSGDDAPLVLLSR